MTVQEVILKALSGEIHWYRAADILGFSPRTLRRWRERYETHGYIGLVDKLRHRPSVRRVAATEIERLLRLYRERYRGFNVRHFHQLARREHGRHGVVHFPKQTLQAAGLVKKHRARGRYRRRRESRACFGELLHIDGSPHAWLALRPTERAVLIAVLDDATKRVLYAQLWPSETTAAIMTALRDVITAQGLPMAVYTDRAHWAFNTPQASGPVNRRQLTQVGRALERLGIEHIPAYSPQARGRSERLNRTFQDRLVNELRVAKITTLSAANAYLASGFCPTTTRPSVAHRRIRPRPGSMPEKLPPGAKILDVVHSYYRTKERRIGVAVPEGTDFKLQIDFLPGIEFRLRDPKPTDEEGR